MSITIKLEREASEVTAATSPKMVSRQTTEKIGSIDAILNSKFTQEELEASVLSSISRGAARGTYPGTFPTSSTPTNQQQVYNASTSATNEQNIPSRSLCVAQAATEPESQKNTTGV